MLMYSIMEQHLNPEWVCGQLCVNKTLITMHRIILQNIDQSSLYMQLT